MADSKYEVKTYKTGWIVDENGNDITDTPEGQAHLERMNRALRKVMQPILPGDGKALVSMEHPTDTPIAEDQELNEDALETVEIELDDPYLELFDRINQLEMDVKELLTLFRTLKDSQDFSCNPRFNVKETEGVRNISQQEFKFFE